MNPLAIGLTSPSLALTDKEKIEAVIEFLTEAHLDEEGGYPYDHTEFRNWVFVATLDGDATSIQSYRRKTLIRWYDEAVNLFDGEDGGEDGEDVGDMVDCLHEANPGEETP